MRDQTFAGILQRAAFENPASPYRRLLLWAGVTFGDVCAIAISFARTACSRYTLSGAPRSKMLAA